MKSDDIAVEISKLQEAATALTTRLDGLLAKYVGNVAKASSDWIRGEIDRRIEYRPDLIQALGTERISALKAKVKTLIAQLPAIAEKEMSDKSKWPHHVPKQVDQYGHNREEPYFNCTFRTLISTLGPILDEFGLLQEKQGYAASWENRGAGNVRYAINPGFEGLNNDTLTEYGAVFHELEVVRANLKAKTDLHAKTKAREMWDSA